MTQSTYSLAAHTLIEPLILSWPAWWMTVAPVPASLHALNSQVRTMRAYLQSPEVHEQLSKDPSISGNSFMNVPAARQEEVRSLLGRTEVELADCLHLAEALEAFQGELLAEAKGQSLEPLYARLPAPLKGLVELVYDYANRPFVRIVEGAAYRSSCYKPGLQSLRFSRLAADDARPYYVSTPRLLEPGQVDWPVELRDPRVDQLFSLDTVPRPLSEIRALLGPAMEEEGFVSSFLTDAVRATGKPWAGPGIRIQYVGHATALVEYRGLTILTDPFIPVHPTGGGAARLSFADLPATIDYALITHAHADHFALESLLRLRHRIRHLVVPKSCGILAGDVSLKMLAQTLGFKGVIDLDTFESIALPDGEIIAAPFLGEHGDIAHSKTAYALRLGRETVLFAADSTCVDEAVYEGLRRSVGRVGTVFMNTEPEGSPLTFGLDALFPKKRDRKLEKSRRCRGSNAREGIRLLEIVGAERVYNYAMGLEPWLTQIIGPASPLDSPRMQESDVLLSEARARGIVAVRLSGPEQILLGH